MENENKKKKPDKKLIIIIVIIAAAAAICLLWIFQPWNAVSEMPEMPQIQTTESAALEDPDAHIGEEVSFEAEAIDDSQNIEGMLVLSAAVDNRYFVSLNYLDLDKTLNFNTGDKVSVTGIITGTTLVPVTDSQPLSGAEIAVQSIELNY